MKERYLKILVGMSAALCLGLISTTLLSGCLTSSGGVDTVFLVPPTDDPGIAPPDLVPVTGYVAINRQNEDVAGVTGRFDLRVESADATASSPTSLMVVTDERGYFSLKLPAGHRYNIFASRPDLAQTKVQNLFVGHGYPAGELVIPIKKPAGAANRLDGFPTLTVRGIRDFQRLDDVKTDITLQSDRIVYQYHLGMNNSSLALKQNRAAFEDAGKEIVLPGVGLAPNPGGKPQFLTVFIADRGNNMTVQFIHLLMPDRSGTSIPEPPTFVEILSTSFLPSSNNWLLSSSILDQPRDYPGIESIINLVTWVASGTGDKPLAFNVYRSFDGIDYSFVHTTSELKFQDVHPELQIGRRTWYKVTSVGPGGESQRGLSAWVEPLPFFTLKLLEPHGEDVPIDPVMRWETADLSIITGLTYTYVFSIKRTVTNMDIVSEPFYGYVEQILLHDKMVNALKFSEAFKNERLVRGETYIWQFYHAEAKKTYIDEKDRRSSAITLAASDANNTMPENTALEFRTGK